MERKMLLKEIAGDSKYFVIYDFCKELKFEKQCDAIVFSYIFNCCMNMPSGSFKGSQKTIADNCYCSVKTCRRSLNNLVEQGYIKSTKYLNDCIGKNMNEYVVDYDFVASFLENHCGQNDHSGQNDHNDINHTGQNDHCTLDKMTDKNIIINNSNNRKYSNIDKGCYSENNNELELGKEEIDKEHENEEFDFEIFKKMVDKSVHKHPRYAYYKCSILNVCERYFEKYKKITGENHPKLNQNAVDKIVWNMNNSDMAICDEIEWKVAIDKHFDIDKLDNNIMVFMSEKCLQNRAYDIANVI